MRLATFLSNLARCNPEKMYEIKVSFSETQEQRILKEIKDQKFTEISSQLTGDLVVPDIVEEITAQVGKLTHKVQERGLFQKENPELKRFRAVLKAIKEVIRVQ